MCRLPNKKIIFYFLFFILSALFSGSCGFMDLRPIGISIFPGEPDTVLPGEYSQVILNFDTEMDRVKTGQILEITYHGGIVEGDLSWEGNRLVFVPVPGWLSGTRYSLNLKGSVYSLDGRELRLDQSVPFYAISQSPAPYLESFFPPDSTSISAEQDGKTILSLRFSQAMDRLSTETSLTLEGLSEKIFSWDDDDRLLGDRNLKGC